MLKTNSAQVKSFIRSYLVEQVNAFMDEREIKTINPFMETWAICKKEKAGNYKYPSDEAMLKDWLQGCTCFGADLYTRPCKPFIKDLLEETESESDRFSEEEATNLMEYLCIREFFFMLKKEIAKYEGKRTRTA